jgi:hypothetical protein
MIDTRAPNSPRHTAATARAIEPPAAVQPSETAPMSASAIIPARSQKMLPAKRVSPDRLTQNRTVQGSERTAETTAETSVDLERKAGHPSMASAAGNDADTATLQPMEILMTQTTKRIEAMMLDSAHFGQDSLEVYFKSTSLWVKGCGDIMRTAAALAQSSAERQTEHIKDAVASRTLHDWSEAQRKIVQTVLQDAASGTMKISETWTTVVSEATRPMTAHADKAVQLTVDALAA